MFNFLRQFLSVPACAVWCGLVVSMLGQSNAQDIAAVNDRLKSAGKALRAESENRKFNSPEQAIATWHKTKEQIITSAVAAGEISETEADMIRVELVKAELAELTKSAAGELPKPAATEPATEGVTAHQIIGYLDKNGDDTISREEASGELLPFFGQLDTNGDGSIDVTEAQVIADYQNGQQTQNGRQAASPARTPAERPLTAGQIIQEMDKNGDKRITRAEASPDLRLFFDKYDVSKDGAIDLEEAQALADYENRHGAATPVASSTGGRVTARQLIGYMDENGDGRISKDEASSELKPYFEQLDANGDGTIDLEEAKVVARYANQSR